MWKPASHWPRAAFLIAGLALLSGCGSARTWRPQSFSARDSSPRQAPSNVIVVRGTAGYWPDCDQFIEKLKAGGAAPTLIRGWEVNRTAEQLAAARQSGDQTGPLVLIGYSRGANDAIQLTRRLQKQGIAIDTLILMETAAQDSVPANVASCLNVYKSLAVADEWVPAFRGLPVTVESAQTHLVNYNLRFHDEAVAETEINHFTVCQNSTVQEMIAERVALALRPADAVNALETQLAGGP